MLHTLSTQHRRINRFMALSSKFRIENAWPTTCFCCWRISFACGGASKYLRRQEDAPVPLRRALKQCPLATKLPQYNTWFAGALLDCLCIATSPSTRCWPIAETALFLRGHNYTISFTPRQHHHAYVPRLTNRSVASR